MADQKVRWFEFGSKVGSLEHGLGVVKKIDTELDPDEISYFVEFSDGSSCWFVGSELVEMEQ